MMKDENWLKSQFSFALVPTNLEDVYTTPSVPDNFNLKKATDTELLHQGIFLRRPTPRDPASYAMLWEKISERGLKTHHSPLTRLPPKTRRIPPKPRGGGVGGTAQYSTNWAGCVVEGSGYDQSVQGTLSLPYLSLPPLQPGQTPAILSAWVGLDGFVSGDDYLFQVCVNFQFDPNSYEQTAFFPAPIVQWWVPDENDPSTQRLSFGYGMSNPPTMLPGNLVQLYCSYIPAANNEVWGQASFVFIDDLNGNNPITITQYILPSPPNYRNSLYGRSVEWILENTSVTDIQPNTVLPVFSGSPKSITPISFTQAFGEDTNWAPIYPSAGFPVLYENSQGQPLDVVSVTLANETVSILYTGPQQQVTIPNECAQLLDTIRNLVTYGGPKLTAKNKAQLLAGLEQCLASGQIGQGEYNGALGTLIGLP